MKLVAFRKQKSVRITFVNKKVRGQYGQLQVDTRKQEIADAERLFLMGRSYRSDLFGTEGIPGLCLHDYYLMFPSVRHTIFKLISCPWFNQHHAETFPFHTGAASNWYFLQDKKYLCNNFFCFCLPSMHLHRESIVRHTLDEI